ncbi:MAG: DUF3572 family protein [Boseongicola sp. SB0677_bin_26]|nr:DUF3572 family protein [Boseongicola sp. SB0665_bin_10]MYG24795.1 DUF3572 family protein [Boseongicola sp. SB0677_bin_26]
MTPLSEDSAEILAIKALSWLVANDELLPVFLGATGATEADLRQRTRDLEFLASVLDFLLMDDAWVQGFCDAAGYAGDFPLRARVALPGGAQVNWT